ncbi:MAG: ABC transporter ATP-binding protein [Steroidobacteraceae bacterium]
MSIDFEQVSKRYGEHAVVNDVSLRIATGEFFVLLGPSGSGKSTLLRSAAGLCDIDHGRIVFDGRDVTHVPARERGVGLVFQHYALFRHMSVAENVEFALRVRGVRRAQRARRRDELLRLVSLEDFAGRMPGQLSGGQQQRVAVARALAHEPAVLLLDEPFGALDAQIRVELRETIRQVQRRIGMTTILVTHDQEEAFALGDRIGVMRNGRLLEAGRPETLYRHPATRFVATFLGAANLLLGEVSAKGLRLGNALLGAGDSVHPANGRQEAIVVVRPEDLEIADSTGRLRHRALAHAHVHSLAFAGASQRLRLQLEADATLQSAVSTEGAAAPLLLEATRNSSEQAAFALAVGQRVAVGVRRVHLLPTPISSFRILASSPQTAAWLREAPLLKRLADSMHARVIDAAQDIWQPGGQPGVTVLAADLKARAAIGAAVSSGAQRLLCLPPDSVMPRRIVICTDTEAARPATLALTASILRHVAGEATFVSLQQPGAARGDVSSSYRRLLDARAELQETHGLDVRTDVQIGELADWLTRLSMAEETTLIVLGLDGDGSRIDAALDRYQALLSGRCPVLLSCSRAPATAVLPTGAPAASTTNHLTGNGASND